jgi:2,3-diketo-5-methylthio-1-phosphopentane phosphatase
LDAAERTQGSRPEKELSPAGPYVTLGGVFEPQRPIRTIVVDFDGTICAADVSDEIVDRFIGPLARELDLDYEEGRIGSRENLVRLAEHLTVGHEEALAWALAHHAVDPTFPPFARWAREAGIEVVVVSDGLGIHIEPMLWAAGIEGLRVVTNMVVLNQGAPAGFDFPAGHPICQQCGTCKMLAVTTARQSGGSVAFVGDGHSDRYGALYSDLVFAKGTLVELCRADGIAFVPWSTFDDVRRGLEELQPDDVPGPIDPATCPGWRDPTESISTS